ncbi:hypothetical protein BGZ70_001344 [Mortierella alpina]|uniref:F-box protein n=1 Tax=Mortierella alpina TaxID=64518 RepID=A0A9P6IW24_MORAP|nr:hypothetical protein BGZ70_001344 [Mortierella alpina]
MHPAETLPQLRAFAREALFVTSTGTHLTQAEAAERAELSQDAERIEFVWKEPGSGSWLGDFRIEEVLEVLRMCPNLECLAARKLIEQDVITHLAPVVAKAMPQLRHLDLTHISDQPLGTRCLLESCKDLISLTMARLQFESRLLVGPMVSRHGHSLESLRIHECARVTSQEVNMILSSCRRLKSFYAMAGNYVPGWSMATASPILNINDMAMVPEKPGWVCKDIKTLELCYSGMDTNIGIPEVLWRQIVQLQKLKDLRIYRHPCCEEEAVHEKESVRQAVSSWLALSDLRRLELRELRAFVDEALVKQAKSQWAKLEWIRCI